MAKPRKITIGLLRRRARAAVLACAGISTVLVTTPLAWSQPQVATRGGAAEEIRLTRTAIQRALEAYKGGQIARAEELVTGAYLDHFEKAEGPLEQKDKTLEKRLEQLIRNDLRGKIKAKAPVAEVEQLVRSILASLDQAEKLLEGY